MKPGSESGGMFGIGVVFGATSGLMLSDAVAIPLPTSKSPMRRTLRIMISSSGKFITYGVGDGIGDAVGTGVVTGVKVVTGATVELALGALLAVGATDGLALGTPLGAAVGRGGASKLSAIGASGVKMSPKLPRAVGGIGANSAAVAPYSGPGAPPASGFAGSHSSTSAMSAAVVPTLETALRPIDP